MKYLRARVGVGQKELGLRAGLSENGAQSAVSRLENARWDGDAPNMRVLDAIADAAGVTLDYFRVGADDPADERRAKLLAATILEDHAAQLRAEAMAAASDDELVLRTDREDRTGTPDADGTPPPRRGKGGGR